MTTVLQAPSPFTARRAGWFECDTRGQALLTGAALFLLLVMIPTFLTMAIEARTLNDINVWIKPAKFEFSVAVQFLTVAWFLQLLPFEQRASRLATTLCQTMAVVGILEIAYIALQASKGEASHFNSSTPLTLFLYSLMGIGAITMLSISGWLGVMILRHGETSRAFVYVAGLSLVAGSLLGSLTGIFISVHQSHWLGGLHTDAGGLPLFGWSRTGGDLRVAHFFSMHIMQAVPIATWLTSFVIPQHRQKVAGLALLCVAILIAVATFVQAVTGHPFMLA
jgi:hypothetical protein